ncbi:MAG: AAA-like domain-containing protein, partial [Cyanobacteria bacterium J06635_10]
MKKILILSANPIDTSSLRLDEEVREIQTGLERAKKREQFEIISKLAVRPEDLQRALLDYEPEIVHFSGHGNGDRGLVLENKSGKTQLVSANSLAGLFNLFKNKVECVVLNACYSKVQAEAIFEYISCVVGMNQEIGDKAAIKFAVGFYDALGAGRSYNDAFEFGRNSIHIAGMPEFSTPVLKLRNNLKINPNNKQIILENPEGQVPLDSAFYIERPPIECDCYETILKPGSLIRVKAPRQMGKSSLMTRILNHATRKNYQAANLNFQDADADFLANLDKFLQWFCSSITEELNLPDKLNDYWKGVLGSKNKCTKYFEKYLLPQISGALALGLDEVDEVFKHPEIAADFFGLLRSWHEKGKNEPVWKKLRLVIVHSKEVYIPLNINQSPFNVGLPIELPELNKLQVQDLVERHGLNWNHSDIKKLIHFLGGHPYLIR